MEVLSRLIIGNDKKNLEKRNIIWNMIGSFLYALASMVLTIAVIQIVGGDEGAEAGGIFTFAFTTFGQHMFMVAYFGIRPFQITDTGNRYSFGDYLGLRFFTCAFALCVGMVYVFFKGYTFVKAATVFLMVVYKVVDALADTYEAEFQRTGRLYLTGKSNAFRTILSVTVFLSVLAATKDLVVSCTAAVAAQVTGFLIFDALVIKALPEVDWKSGKGKKWLLLKDNTLLFFSVILDFYIFSASKYAVENCMADKDMAVYGAIFMPTSVINLVAGFVIRPYLTKMAFAWEMNRTRQFKKLIGQLAAVIGVLTVLAVGGAWFLGIPVLSLLYSNIRYALADCRVPLVLIIIGGALNAFMNLFYYSLIIMKKQRFIFVGYGIVAVLAAAVSTPLVGVMGLLGGSASYVFLMAVLMIVFGIFAVYFISGKEREGR